jgi:RND family efflux transporter MFP subunit
MLASALLLGAGACKSRAAEPSAETPSQTAISVQTETVTEVEAPITLRLTGTLRGNRETDLAANASGRVLATSVERGEQIKPGQVIAKLDVRAAALSASEARAQAESARAQEDQARVECERYQKLREKGAISDMEFDQKISQCRTLPLTAEAATARARLAAQNVGDGVIRAPFAGVVTERSVEVGQYVRQDSKVVTIVSLDPLRLEMAVPESDVGKVQEGAEVTFAVTAYPGRRFAGKIRFVSGALRSTTRDMVVEALVDNADKALKPGMFADVELSTGTRKLPSIPKAAVLERDGQSRAFFVVNGRLEERVLSLGPALDKRQSVLKGAALGEKVALGELAKFSNGQKVR